VTARKIKRDLSLAYEAWDRFSASGEFDLAAYRAEMFEKLKPFKGHAYARYVDSIVRTVDEHAQRSSCAPGLFPEFDLEGVYALGKGKRVAKRLATIDQADRAMLLDDRNLEAVVKVNTRKRGELIKLRPYWTNGRSKAEAVAAYRADQAASDEDGTRP
jgi:hypothetical protein